VDRYSAIIVGQFFGHTHNDQFSVFTGEDGEKTVSFILKVFLINELLDFWVIINK